MVAELKQISIHEFRQMEYEENDKDFYELVNSYVLQKSTPKPHHQLVSMNLCWILGNYLRTKKLGELFAAPIDVFLDD